MRDKDYAQMRKNLFLSSQPMSYPFNKFVVTSKPDERNPVEFEFKKIPKDFSSIVKKEIFNEKKKMEGIDKED